MRFQSPERPSVQSSHVFLPGSALWKDRAVAEDPGPQAPVLASGACSIMGPFKAKTLLSGPIHPKWNKYFCERTKCLAQTGLEIQC